MGMRGMSNPVNTVGEVVVRAGKPEVIIGNEKLASMSAAEQALINKYKELGENSGEAMIDLAKARSPEEAMEILGLVSKLAPHLSIGVDPADLGKAGIKAIRDYQKKQRAAMGEEESSEIAQPTEAAYNRARQWRYTDPLVLDLDGDGIETVGATGYSTVLFDHDGDGTRTGTGWVKSDDGLLVWDRNHNGLIDSGAELFGVDTVLASGQKAADGFAALADLDSSHDGKFDAADSAYADLRIWRDLNQDGISQANELKSLLDSGIATIGLAATASTVNLGNGNTQTATAGYTRTDGTTGTAANLNLVQNAFYREFGDSIAVSATAAVLPGMVRELREAANDGVWEKAA